LDACNLVVKHCRVDAGEEHLDIDARVPSSAVASIECRATDVNAFAKLGENKKKRKITFRSRSNHLRAAIGE
jgi:hypothetical protein